jgi:hypothetical protein
MRLKKMTANARDELLAAIRPEYLESRLGKKKVLLDSFVNATGYCRKYATTLLSQGVVHVEQRKERARKKWLRH